MEGKRVLYFFRRLCYTETMSIQEGGDRMDEHTGLVLEGGGMRGLFTGGVLDFFLDKGWNSLM